MAAFEHSCKTAGAWGCGYTAKAGSEEELKTKIVDHARRVHKVTMTDTIYNYLRKTAQR